MTKINDIEIHWITEDGYVNYSIAEVKPILLSCESIADMYDKFDIEIVSSDYLWYDFKISDDVLYDLNVTEIDWDDGVWKRIGDTDHWAFEKRLV